MCINMIFAFYGWVDFVLNPSFLLSWMFVWTHAVLGILYACVLYFVLALVQCN